MSARVPLASVYPRRLAVLLGLAVALAGFLLGHTAPAQAAGNKWVRAEPLLIAHQGGEDEFPSNTLYAYKQALRAGAQMLELDIGVSKDGHVVVTRPSIGPRTATARWRR
jgi:glycerophosphoryl diester phosphodiesterase